MCHVFLNACIYAKQKINLTWPYCSIFQTNYLLGAFYGNLFWVCHYDPYPQPSGWKKN